MPGIEVSFVTTGCPADFSLDARPNRGPAVEPRQEGENLGGPVVAIQGALKPSDLWLASQERTLGDSAAAGRDSPDAGDTA